MIINFIIKIIFDFFSAIFSFLPTVSIATIPVIGETVSSLLLQIVQVYHAFIETFPYAIVGFNVLIYVILPFELLMLVAKFFLGHRAPNSLSHD